MANFSPSWDHYRSFLMVLRTGSLSAAARSLGVKQSTVGRQIEALEDELKIPRFTRSQRGLRPTDAAIRLRPHLETLAATSEALIRDAQVDDSGTSGTVRVTTSETVGYEILPKVLMDLQLKLPEIKIEISISNDLENLLSREADIAIRSGPMDQKAIVAKKVGEIDMGLFASKEYLRGKKIPKTDEDLKDLRLIGFDGTSRRARGSSKLAAYLDKNNFAYCSNNVSLHSRLVDEGCGLGLCWADHARADRVRILPEVHGAYFPLWVAMHENLKKNRKFRAVFNELAVSLKARLG